MINDVITYQFFRTFLISDIRCLVLKFGIQIDVRSHQSHRHELRSFEAKSIVAYELGRSKDRYQVSASLVLLELSDVVAQ